MKYNVQVGEKTFEVEIEDLNARPVIARVAGEVFEVSPEQRVAAQVAAPAPVAEKKAFVAAAPVSVTSSGNALVSPLPGTVVEVFVKPGEKVEAGQVLLIIEAMKMKNSIRSVRTGLVKSIPVSAGQTVAHKQVLVEFEA